MTPRFEYSISKLQERGDILSNFNGFSNGLISRFAAKANPHEKVIKLFNDAGIHFDASSSYETQDLLEQGIAGSKISLSSQQPAHNLSELLDAGVLYVATSMHQLELFLTEKNRPSKVGLRVNPGLGAGHNNRTTTGGANSSFGLWNSYLAEALALAKKYDTTIDRLHVHIGSGADPNMWGSVMDTALELVDEMPDVTSLDIGGGYKIHRFADEQEADMGKILSVFATKLSDYEQRTTRKIQLEIEPGTWLVAHAGTLIAEVVDIVDTGADGHTFLRINTGMNDIIRPSMYGAQHKIEIVNTATEKQEYVVVGHNCETGDILTTATGDPESIAPRLLNKANIGDAIKIYDTGAYCASFAAHGYNSFPNAKEIFVD